MEKEKLNPTLHYVLSVLGLVCCCFAGLGFIPAGIAAIMAHNKLKKAELDPENYDNVKAMETARMIATVIVIINFLYFGKSIYEILNGGWEHFIEAFKEGYERGLNGE